MLFQSKWRVRLLCALRSGPVRLGNSLHFHEQIPAGNVKDQALGTGQIGRRYLADRHFAEDKPNPMSAVWNRSRMEPLSFGAYRPLTSPDLLEVGVASD